MSVSKPSTGVIGGGLAGRGLAILLDRANYAVTVGTRWPDVVRSRGLPAAIGVGTPQDAADCEVVVLAVRHSALRAALAMIRPQLAAKVLIDTGNAFILRDYIAAGLSSTLTEGIWLARQVPETLVARAFSHIVPDLLVSRSTAQPGHWAVAYAADDPAAVCTVRQMIADVGYVPVRVGTLAQSAPLDAGGILWPYMFTPDDMREALTAHVSPAVTS